MLAIRLVSALALALVFVVASALAGCGPRIAADALSDVDGISGGADMTCAHRRDGTTWCWGDDALTGDILGRVYAKPASTARIVATAKYSAQACVVLEDRTVACGTASFGLSGSRVSPPDERGLSPMRGLEDVAQIGTGTYIDCVRRNDGTVACWGDYAEVLRTGTYDRKRRSGVSDPAAAQLAEVRGLPSIADLSVGAELALAVGRDGSVWTVGGLARGVERVAGIDDAVQAASGDSFHCVRRRSGVVSCWRDGFAIESLANVASTPAAVENVTHAVSIAAGAYGACAIVEGGRAMCWGRHVGVTKDDAPSWLTARAIPHGEHLRALMVGAFHACGLVEDGHVLCWGGERLLGIGSEAQNATAARGSGYVRTGASDTPDAKVRRVAMLVGVLTLLGLVIALVYARVVARTAEATWRRLPVAPLAVGGGYRASEVALTRTEAPRLVRIAIFVVLASVGADMAFLSVFGLYSMIAGSLALRQLARDPVSAGANFATALLSVVVVAWLVLVVKTLVGAARASKKALGRLRVLGILGALGHVLLGLVTFGGRRELAWLLGRSSFGTPAPAADVVWMLLLLASVVGVVGSIVSVVAARHRGEGV